MFRPGSQEPPSPRDNHAREVDVRVSGSSVDRTQLRPTPLSRFTRRPEGRRDPGLTDLVHRVWSRGAGGSSHPVGETECGDPPLRPTGGEGQTVPVSPGSHVHESDQGRGPGAPRHPARLTSVLSTFPRRPHFLPLSLLVLGKCSIKMQTTRGRGLCSGTPPRSEETRGTRGRCTTSHLDRGTWTPGSTCGPTGRT